MLKLGAATLFAGGLLATTLPIWTAAYFTATLLATAAGMWLLVRRYGIARPDVSALRAAATQGWSFAAYSIAERMTNDADKVVLCDIFAAGEKPIDGISSETLVRAIKEAGHKDVSYVARREDIAAMLDPQVKNGDLVITLGAGDIQLTCNELTDALEKRLGPASKKNPARR